MDGFSIVDGFVEITECLAEMIKYVANEPSAGLFYIQQHTQNAVPNLISLNDNVVAKSRETTLDTQDLDDSITMVKSMKECGFPIADEMIKDIKKSLVIVSTKPMETGLIHNLVSGSQMGRASSWGPATWGLNADFSQNDGDGTSYLSSVFKSAKQKASNIKWPHLDTSESMQKRDLPSFSNSPLTDQCTSTNSTMPEIEANKRPLSGTGGEEPAEGEDVQGDLNLASDSLLCMSKSYDDFKAHKEAKLEKWLDGTENDDDLKGTRR